MKTKAVILSLMLTGSWITQISAQERDWTQNNLDVVTFNNGDSIPEAKTDLEWKEAAALQDPVWCYANNDPSTNEKMGKLYNFYAVTDPRGLAPQGYRIAGKSDFTIYLAPDTKHISYDGVYIYRSFYGEFGSSPSRWTMVSNGPRVAYALNFIYSVGILGDKGNGYPVRCIKVD